MSGIWPNMYKDSEIIVIFILYCSVNIEKKERK